MTQQLAASFGATTWLLMGALLGAGGLVLARRVRAWREARIAGDWDPY